MNVSLEEIALELVRLEKENPSTHDPKETIAIYEDYVMKVHKYFKACNNQ